MDAWCLFWKPTVQNPQSYLKKKKYKQTKKKQGRGQRYWYQSNKEIKGTSEKMCSGMNIDGMTDSSVVTVQTQDIKTAE